MSQIPPSKSELLSQDLLTENQDLCLTRLFETDATLVVADMGFGKTVVTLSAISELLAEGVVNRVLILAPLKVCRTVWKQEATKWEHLNHLNIALALGTVQERVHAIESNAEIVLMNYENLPWFCDLYKDSHGFNGLVCDEISKLKNSGGRGFKKLRHRLKPFVWRVGLSGTPVSEDFEGLYGQSMILDSGKRLGTRKDIFMRRYFYPLDYQERNWALLDTTGAGLLDEIADLLFVTDNSTYQKSLTPITQHIVTVKLPSKSRIVYESMKIDFMVDDITAANAAVMVGKLLQISNGFLYGDELLSIPTTRLHAAKIDCIKQLVKTINAPVIIAYWFNFDLSILTDAFPAATILSGNNDLQTIDDWNSGKLPILLLQPRSAGHGIQLQWGGADLIWYGPIWSRDLVLQTEARIHRQGQTKPVNIYTICAAETIDNEVLKRVENKGGYAELLTAHLG